MSAFNLSEIIRLIAKANESGISLTFSENELSVNFKKGETVNQLILAELKANKENLITYFKNYSTQQNQVVSLIEKFNRADIVNIPLSFSQERLWFIDQLEGSIPYHLPTVLHLKGEVNIDALDYAFKSIVNRHEILRTVIYEKNGQGFQKVINENRSELQIIDGAGYKANKSALQEFIRQLIRESFDLSKDQKLRASLIKIDKDEYILVATMHHIASDAWSSSVLVKEVAEFYTAFVEKRDSRLAPLSIQYADFAVWQRGYLQGDTLQAKLEYWKTKLQEADTLNLSTDFNRPTIQSNSGATYRFEINNSVSDKLIKLSKDSGCTLFMTLLSAYKVLLCKYSGQYDISVGTSMASREQAELESLIGFFVNTLVLRDILDPQELFSELLQKVKNTTVQAYEHQDVPFEKVVEATVKERDPSRNPLFQVMLVLANTPEVSALQLDKMQLERENYEANISKFDFTFFLNETPEGLIGAVQYSTDLFKSSTIHRMVDHFITLLTSITENPQQKLQDISIASTPEQTLLLTDFGQHTVTYPQDKTITELFEWQAAQTPDQTALTFEDKKLTYHQLNQQANQLAHALIEQGVKPETLVPIYLTKGQGMIIAILGVLKAGGAYVPIDSEFPLSRVDYMLKDSGAKLLLSERVLSKNLDSSIHKFNLDELDLNLQPTSNPQTKAKANSLAYVIYTSGSTGQPKGVMIEHGNLTDYVFGLKANTPIDQCRNHALVSTIATDLGNTVIYGSLLSGGNLHVFSKETTSDPEALSKYFKQNQIDCLKIVPSHYKALSQQQPLLPQKLLIFGGEALKSEDILPIQQADPNLTIVNHYGPTETTIGKLLHTIEPNRVYGKTIPIGKPFSNTKVYVLDAQQHLSPIGVPGQLYIAGDGLARGYLNNEALTNEKFTLNPYNQTRMYATGDLVKYLEDGNLEYLGRIDQQVKIRGYRIELSEIERALNQIPTINQSVVIAKEDKQGNKQLLAYVVGNKEFDKPQTIQVLKQSLPDYMIPASITQIDEIPLTLNGKIDYKTLPDPEQPGQGGYSAPLDETEQRLAEIWQEILEVDQVGRDDDFFELGGHSLLAIRLISVVRKAFETEMPIGDIFDYPTIAQLKTRLNKSHAVLPAITPQPKAGPIPLSFSQERLWFIDKLEGSISYHIPTVLRLSGPLDLEALEFVLQAIINRHEVLRTVIYEIDGIGYQRVNPKNQWKLLTIDGTTLSTDNLSLRQKIQQLISKPFDLSKDDMLRAQLIKLSETENLLVVTLHHIASDGWSTSIIVKEILDLYKAFKLKRFNLLEDLPIQYADFAIWQRKYLEGEILNQKLAYWKRKLEGVPALDFPTDYVRPAVQSIRGKSIKFSIDKKLTEQLKDLSQQNNATLFMTLLSAFKVLLYKYSSQQDICVGVQIAGRNSQELEGLIGFFLNALALRTQVQGEQSFNSLLNNVKQTTLEAYEHQEVPFEKVVEEVVKERYHNRSPIFQVLFGLQNTPEVPQLNIDDLQIHPENFTNETSKFEIILSLTEYPDGLQGNLRYSTDLFTASTAENLASRYEVLLNSIVSNPDESVNRLNLLPQIEVQSLINGFNVSKIDSSLTNTCLAFFEQQVLNKSEKIALEFEGKQFSFADLEKRSNQLAHYLKLNGVTKGQKVPIYLERGLDMIVALLGIWKAGAAYVPIDLDLPANRVQFIVEDCDAPLSIGDESTSEKFLNCIKNSSNSDQYRFVNLTTEIGKIQEQLNTKPESDFSANDLAYIIYTSGSTGQPKGVMIEHRSIVDYLLGLNAKTNIAQCDSFALVSTIATDLGNTVIFSSLAFGGNLHIFSKETVSDPDKLYRYFSNKPIDCLKIVPSHWKVLSENERLLLPKKLLIFGGEALNRSVLESIFEANSECQVLNHYGPTETTIGKLLYPVTEPSTYPKTVPIGKPFGNNVIYVLSKSKDLCGIGIPGELYIGGDGLARGYLNNANLSETKFIKNPFSTFPEIIYSTGDLVKYLESGDVEYISRIDEQVKIRGYRVELGEIESVLIDFSSIKQAVVLAQEDKSESKKLVAYTVLNDDYHYDKSALIEFLHSNLPEYMVPSHILEIESIPLMPNGKIDKKALPNPEIGLTPIDKFLAPQDETEKRLAEIWEDILEVENIGVHDDFFELGGHSLLAIRLISAIRKAFEVEMPIGDIFDYPSIAKLKTRLIVKEESVIPVIEALSPRPVYIPLSFSQERLWFIDKLEGSLQYHIPTVLRLKGNLNIEALRYSFQQIINRHEILRTVIREHNGEGYQYVKEINQWNLSIEDVSELDSKILAQKIKESISKPFDLSEDYMVRVDMFQLSAIENVLVVTMHHIASDGWSNSITVKELIEYYEASTQSREAVLPPINIQFADYAIWQRKYIDGDVLNQKLNYWSNKLEDVSPLDFPTDFVRPAIQSNRGASSTATFDIELTTNLNELSRQKGTTLFMTLLAAFKVLLHRYTGQEDICVGTPIAGRQYTELESLIGFFVNTLALRSTVNSKKSFVQFLDEVRSTTLEAYAHQEAPFEKIVEALVHERDMSRSPIFQVLFVLQNTPDIPELNFGELQLSGEQYEQTVVKYDLAFFITEDTGGLKVSMQYCSDLFKEDTIVRFINHYRQLLQSIVSKPDQQIAKLSFISDEEENYLLNELNDTAVDIKDNQSLVSLYEEMAAKHPEKIALTFEDQHYSFRILNEKANQLAHFLKSEGIENESVIPICFERGLDMIVSLLGVLKVGAAYVPIDPDYPQDRISYMLQDCKGKFALTKSTFKEKFKTDNGDSSNAIDYKIFEIDTLNKEIKKQSSANLNISVETNNLAYIIYTSGSTGLPKGVMIEHVSVVNLLLSMARDVAFTADSSFLSVTTYSFDISYLEIFLPLISGGTLVMVPRETALDGYQLSNALSKHKPSHLQATPATWNLLIDAEWRNLERLKILIGGEAVKESLKDQLARLGTVYNLYGPTETTIWSAIEQLSTDRPVLIGNPIANTQIYVLGNEMQLQPIGVAGEICIGGIGVGRGYKDRQSLNEQKFVRNPFSKNKQDRLYKTGDLGRWLANGKLEYLRRLDDQVKIRGYRIEPGEIESRLMQSDLVNQAVVLVKESNIGKQLIGYYTPKWEAIKLRESELYLAQIESWKAVYETNYVEETIGDDPEFDINIWKDSFTGEPIPVDQMKQWVSEVVEEILSEKPNHVLEIGSGTGLIFYPLAGKVNQYTGTDFSKVSIQKISDRVAQGLRNYGNYAFKVCAAHEIETDHQQPIDTILLNSVIQYFPGEAYMTEVIARNIKLLKGKGRIIIGDVRDQRLLELFKARLNLDRMSRSASIKAFNWAVTQDYLKEEELCFSPEYFYSLKSQFPEITHIEIKWKQGDYINELSLYRYTVVCYVDDHRGFENPEWVSWDAFNDKNEIVSKLEKGLICIGIKDAPNPRLVKERQLQLARSNKLNQTIGDLNDALEVSDFMHLEINRILQLATSFGYSHRLLLASDPMLVNIVFEKEWSQKFIENPAEKHPKSSGQFFTNTPLFNDISYNLKKEIRSMLLSQLPEYMVPSDLIALQNLPLTNNGKVDRKFLSELQDGKLSSNLNYTAPVTETELKLVEIWKDLLGINRIGTKDDFFELGGHSLLAMRVISSIRKEFGLELIIKEIFQFTTIDQLSKFIDIQLNNFESEADSTEFDLHYI
jgi:amino acid adenylation domain-containing protein